MNENADPSQLTEREEEVAKLAAQGSANNEIAESLGISAEAVRSHLKAIYSKLEQRSRRN